MPVGHLDPAVTFLGLEACDYSRSYLNGEPDRGTDDVGNSGVSCATWRFGHAPNIIAFSGSVRAARAKLPVTVYIDARDLTAHSFQTVIVDVVGGPGGDISPGINDSLQLALADRGSIVVKLGYTGTRHGTLFPRPNLEAAVWEVADYAKRLRARHPTNKLVLLGESLGGNIVARAAGSIPPGTVDGMILAIPLVFSPDAFMAHFRQMLATSRTQATKLSVRIIDRPGAPWTAGHEAAVSTEKLFASFFPVHARRQGLRDLLGPTAGIRTLLAYGDLDDRVGNQELSGIGGPGSRVRTLKLAPLNHNMSTYWAQLIADGFDDLLR